MWQRVQTIYLILLTVVMCLTLVFPFATFPTENTEVTFNLFGITKNEAEVNSWIPYYILVGLSVGLSVFSITQFKNRKRQLNLGKINYLVILTLLVLVFVEAPSIAKQLGLTENGINYGLGIYMPVAAIAFTFLANRGIKKDEEMVKSVDRLR